MILFNLGCAVLLAVLFPLATQLLQVFGFGFRGGSPVYSHLFVLAVTYIPAYIAAALLSHFARLKHRLPPKQPGRAFLVAGLILLVLFLMPRLLASTVEGGGPAFLMQQFAPFFIYPARLLILIGVVQVLLAALPRITNRSTRTPTGDLSVTSESPVN